MDKAMTVFQVFSMFAVYGMSFILGLVLAPLIYKDAAQMPKLFLNTTPIFWAICAPFLGPLFTMVIYWAIHHSSISNRVINND